MEENSKQLKIVFLDVDGVLNCMNTIDRIDGYIGIEDNKVTYLKKIIDETAAKIVLVSTWKEFWHKKPYKIYQDNLANYLDKKLSRQGLKVVDKTSEPYDLRKRGQGILDYLNTLKSYGLDVYSYVILDDLMFDYRKTNLYKNLIKTNYRSGLKLEHVKKAIEILNNKKGEN